jgi:hypothetical protein
MQNVKAFVTRGGGQPSAEPLRIFHTMSIFQPAEARSSAPHPVRRPPAAETSTQKRTRACAVPTQNPFPRRGVLGGNSLQQISHAVRDIGRDGTHRDDRDGRAIKRPTPAGFRAPPQLRCSGGKDQRKWLSRICTHMLCPKVKVQTRLMGLFAATRTRYARL